MHRLPYRVELTRTAGKRLKTLARQRKDRDRIAQAIEGLGKDPRPGGIEPVKGSGDPLTRIRVGDYRIIYQIKDEDRTVTVINIGHRKDVYRNV